MDNRRLRKEQDAALQSVVTQPTPGPVSCMIFSNNFNSCRLYSASQVSFILILQLRCCTEMLLLEIIILACTYRGYVHNFMSDGTCSESLLQEEVVLPEDQSQCRDQPSPANLVSINGNFAFIQFVSGFLFSVYYTFWSNIRTSLYSSEETVRPSGKRLLACTGPSVEWQRSVWEHRQACEPFSSLTTRSLG